MINNNNTGAGDKLLQEVDTMVRFVETEVPPGSMCLDKLKRNRSTFLAQPHNKDMQRTLRITLSANQKILQRIRETYEPLKSVYDTRRAKLEDLKERSLGCCLGLLNSDAQQKKLAEKIVDTIFSYRKMIATWKFFEITDNFLQNWEALIAQYVAPQEPLDENVVNYWKNTLNTDDVTAQTFVSQYTAYLEQKTCSLCFTRISTEDLYTERRLCGFHYYGTVLKPRVTLCLTLAAVAGKGKEALKTQKELEQLDKSLIRKKKIESSVIDKLLALTESIENSDSNSSNKGPKKASVEDLESYSAATGPHGESPSPPTAPLEEQQQKQKMESDDEEEEEDEEKEEEEEEEEEEESGSSSCLSGDGEDDEEEEEEIVEKKRKRVVNQKKRQREEEEEEEGKKKEKRLKNIAWVLDNYGSHLSEDVGNLLKLAYDSTDSAFETTAKGGAGTLNNAEDPRFGVFAVTPIDGSVFLESVHSTFAEAQLARRPDSGYFKRSILTIPKPKK